MKTIKNRNLRNRMKQRARQAGYSLLEIIVAVAIIGLALAGLAWQINKGFNANDIKDETSGVTTLMAALPDVRSGTGYGTAGATLLPQLVAQNAIPATYQIGGTAAAPTVTNSWGGAVTVIAGTPNTAAEIQLANVPQEACNKMATKISKGANFQSTKINSTVITGPVTATAANAACTAAANTVMWRSHN